MTRNDIMNCILGCTTVCRSHDCVFVPLFCLHSRCLFADLICIYVCFHSIFDMVIYLCLWSVSSYMFATSQVFTIFDIYTWTLQSRFLPSVQLTSLFSFDQLCENKYYVDETRT